MSTGADYRIGFIAVLATAPEEGADQRLWSALESLPGIDGVVAGGRADGAVSVSGAFRIRVRLGMADAARDGSRLAKEALKVAGMGDAQLVELTVTLEAP